VGLRIVAYNSLTPEIFCQVLVIVIRFISQPYVQLDMCWWAIRFSRAQLQQFTPCFHGVVHLN